jgi:ssDNA-binding Zn-finger/Zn-ribbon topoisomerase 1
MDGEQELMKAELSHKWTCPECGGELHKRRADMGKAEVLPLGVRACHDCNATWFMQRLNR